MKNFWSSFPARIEVKLLANFAGTGWSTLMQLAFVPVYIRFMGIEAFGLIGLYITLQSALQILDFGLSPTMNREMARYSVMPEKASEARDFVRTFEVGYWTIGLMIGTAVLVAAPFIAMYWIKANSLPVNVVQQAVMIMGVVIALQWPISFYQGGLLGLQQQVRLNAIKIGTITLSSGGTALILWLISPTITAFFVWQVFTSVINVTLTTVFLWRRLPPSPRRPRFDPSLVRNIWRFAAGMSGITLSALILTQLDKIILSNLLSLEMFGYYILAGTVVTAVAMIAASIFNVVFPLFSSLVAVDGERRLITLYHRSSQLMAVLVLPVTAVVALFSFDLLFLWTGNAETARNAAPIASLLVIGSALNALMVLPYTLQLAYGWTSIGLRIAAFLSIILVPAIFFMTTRYGAIGAACVWVALNIIYMLIGVPFTHRRLLKGETWRWIGEDVGLPLIGAILVAGAGRWLISSPMSPGVAILSLAGVCLGALVTSAFAAPQIRLWVLSQWTRVRLIHA